jgi:hypothetical protein
MIGDVWSWHGDGEEVGEGCGGSDRRIERRDYSCLGGQQSAMAYTSFGEPNLGYRGANYREEIESI